MKTAILKVSGKTNPNRAAGAIAARVNAGNDKIEVTTIGGRSLNQLVKAVAIARGFVIPTGKDLSIVPSFTEVNIPVKGEEEGLEHTALFITIEVKKV